MRFPKLFKSDVLARWEVASVSLPKFRPLFKAFRKKQWTELTQEPE